jgi:hypothetical protein
MLAIGKLSFHVIVPLSIPEMMLLTLFAIAPSLDSANVIDTIQEPGILLVKDVKKTTS